ncbi:ABC transporter permease [Solirubrobacter ginsenosidimutans]|uniref:Transport permease protein n=1 Tax=Solirubrobacter ginsenosidimutans TaxID=490573 RepID=A0A9X3S4Q2_9ACTN|nr:ABC transporter permease [Solirubrobacter ginsenosidimutans]MDA0164732.1 ABC transporter permease [Solirubrobacter ginsenosidimutans]
MSVDASLLGPPIKGPSALGTDPRRLWHLARTMAVSDFKLRFFGSALGYLWQLVRPLMLFGVLYVVFTEVVRLGGDVEFYPVALLMGVVLFTFFGEATGGSLSSLVDREALIRKVDFPRLAVPLSAILTALMNVALNLVAVIVFLLASGGRVRLSWLEVPFLIVALAAFTFGLGMLFSALFVRYRDIRPIWEVCLQILFYASPIFYPIDVVADRSELAAKLMMLNPFAAVVQQMRHALIAPSHPSAVAVAGVWIIGTIAIWVGAIALGYRVFSKRAPLIAEQL